MTSTLLPSSLQGAHAPLGVELDLDRFVVEGEIPASLDGWLYRIVVVVDAHDLDAPTVARVRLPHRIPAGFHGAWVPR